MWECKWCGEQRYREIRAIAFFGRKTKSPFKCGEFCSEECRNHHLNALKECERVAEEHYEKLRNKYRGTWKNLSSDKK
jgi:hypothetical protein